MAFEAYDLHKDKHFDWKTLVVPHGDACYDIPNQLRAEAEAAQDDTVFGVALRAHLEERGHEKIRRSSFNLPFFLEILRQDHSQKKGAYIYISASRGLDLLAPGVEMKPSECENYSSATCPKTGYPAEVEKDIQRLHQFEFVLPWHELAAEIGSEKEKPSVIHSLGAVMRGGKVRIVIDASSGQHEHSINDLMTKGAKTCFSSVEQARLAMSQRGSVARADLSDAFLQSPLSARSCELCGFKWINKQGVSEYWAYRTLGFGFSIGPAWQQDLAVMAMRATVRMCAAAGCATTTMPEYNQHQRITTPARRGHQLTAVLALLDDFGFFATSRKMTHFAWVKFLYLTGKLGMVVSTKPGKTDPPATQMLYLGIELNLRDMTAKLHEERVIAMREKLREVHGMDTIRRKQLQSIIGVLVFASCIIRCGRAAYSHLLQLLRESKGASKIKMDTAARQDIEMWLELLSKLNSRTVISGVRMKCSRWHVYTDASYTGWAWTAGFGCMDYGVWPKSWELRMGQSKFACIWICECEILTVAFAIRYLAPLAANSRLTIHCDNLPVVQMLKKHSSASSRCCRIVAEIEWALAVYGVEINPVHCRTYDNVLADAGSRHAEPDFDLAGFNELVREWKTDCQERCPTAPEECAMQRPDLLELWQKHIVKLDLWQDAPTTEDVTELERLLPSYLRTNKEDTAWICKGKGPARVRAHELRGKKKPWRNASSAQRSASKPSAGGKPSAGSAPRAAGVASTGKGGGTSALAASCSGAVADRSAKLDNLQEQARDKLSRTNSEGSSKIPPKAAGSSRAQKRQKRPAGDRGAFDKGQL